MAYGTNEGIISIYIKTASCSKCLWEPNFALSASTFGILRGQRNAHSNINRCYFPDHSRFSDSSDEWHVRSYR